MTQLRLNFLHAMSAIIELVHAIVQLLQALKIF